MHQYTGITIMSKKKINSYVNDLTLLYSYQ